VTLQIHRSERADVLLGALGELLVTIPADPFTPEVVAVPSRGVERWISQALSASLGGSARDGICANIDFPSPAQVVAEALTAGTGVEPRDDPWAEHRLSWVLLDVVDRCGRQPWCATLGRHLGLLEGQVDQGRRVATAQKVAALFAGYGAQRPGMLQDWAAGRDTDGLGSSLADDLVWQAELWRRVRAEIGSPSPAERTRDVCALLREEPRLVELPGRVSVFGPTRLTTEQLLVLDALGEHRDVHLWLPHPSHVLWDEVADGSAEVVARRLDPTVDVPRHPLLRSCDRPGPGRPHRGAGHGRDPAGTAAGGRPRGPATLRRGAVGAC
jgi:exodeoxyribonuclease V gamma subunit